MVTGVKRGSCLFVANIYEISIQSQDEQQQQQQQQLEIIFFACKSGLSIMPLPALAPLRFVPNLQLHSMCVNVVAVWLQ